MWSGRDGSVTIKRSGDYAVNYELVPLDVVAGKTRVMEDAFISASGTDITEAFRLYLRPLLGSALPPAARLRAGSVAKVLNAAAMTYVAAMITAFFQLLYFVLRLTSMRSSERES